MPRSHPNPGMHIPVSLTAYQQLLGASARSGFEKEDWEIAAEAIEEWLRRHDPEAIPRSPTNGYQWKQLFLPSGALLRTVFRGKNYHCLVEGDELLYDQQAISPSRFVNAVGGVRRNAWLCTWVLFPNTQQWKLADSLRSGGRRRRAAARKAAPPKPAQPHSQRTQQTPPGAAARAHPGNAKNRAHPSQMPPAAPVRSAVPAASGNSERSAGSDIASRARPRWSPVPPLLDWPYG